MLVCFSPGTPPVEVPNDQLPASFANLPPGFIPGQTPLLVTTRTGMAPEPFYIPTIKQVEGHICPAKNLLYGGRAGTGKSIFLRMDGHIRCTLQKGYRALLVRRLLTELKDTHLDKLTLEAEALGGVYRASENTVVYPQTNSRFRFGHVEDDKALKQYLSSEFDVIYFDEGATFTEFQYRFLCSRLRSVKTGVKAGVVPMVRVGSNPGAMWLYDYYISHEVDAQRDPGYRAKEHYFIAATHADNPHLNSDEYELRLNSLPSEALRRMYRDGDWLAVEGQFYGEWRPTRPIMHEDGVTIRTTIPWHVIEEPPRHRMSSGNVSSVSIFDLPWLEIVRAIDWGYSEKEPGVCLWFACLPDGSAIGFQEYVFNQTIPEDVARKIAAMSKFPNGKPMKIRYSVGDPSMFAERTGPSVAEVFSRKKNGGVTLIEGDNSHPAGFTRVHAWLKTEMMSGEYPHPALQFLSPSLAHHFTGCPYTIKTFPMLTEDGSDPSRIGKHQPDHGADATKYFVMSRPAASISREPKKTLAHLPPYIRKAITRGAVSRSRLGVESVRRK